MDRSPIRDLFVGLFVLAGIAAIAYLSIGVSGFSRHGPAGLKLSAAFDEIGGLAVRAPVVIAGVRVGEISSISLQDDFRAKVVMDLDPKLKLPTDTSAAIVTAGVLGDRYIELQPGGDDKLLKSGDTITSTESAVILERLIGQLVYGKTKGAAPEISPAATAPATTRAVSTEPGAEQHDATTAPTAPAKTPEQHDAATQPTAPAKTPEQHDAATQPTAPAKTPEQHDTATQPTAPVKTPEQHDAGTQPTAPVKTPEQPNAGAPPTARAVMEKVTQDALATLRDPKLSADEKREKVKQIAYQNMNFDVMGQLSLGKFRRGLTDAQRTQYQEEFKQLVTNTYGHTTDSYTDEDVKVIGDRQEQDGDYTVQTSITGTKDGKPGQEVARVDYRLRMQGNQWKVIDFTIDGVSLVANYRSQFQGIMSAGGIDQLIKQLHDKNAANEK